MSSRHRVISSIYLMKDLVSKPYLSVSGKDKYGQDQFAFINYVDEVDWPPWGNGKGGVA